MKARQLLSKNAPAYQAVGNLEQFVQTCGIEHRLIDLIKLRASLINGCAFCVDMHVKEARKRGLSEQWINMVGVWRESPVYDARERAVLTWTDAVTEIARTGAPDAAYDGLRQHFSEEEILNLTVLIGTINIWNRLAVGFRLQHPVDAIEKAA